MAQASTAAQRPKLALSEHAWRRRALLLITPHHEHAPTRTTLEAIAARAPLSPEAKREALRKRKESASPGVYRSAGK